MADATSVSRPCLTRGIQASRSPIFGAPPTPVPWHFTHCASTICSPVRGGVALRPAHRLGPVAARLIHHVGDRALDLDVGQVHVAAVRRHLPNALRGVFDRPLRPFAARSAHAFLSPIFGAPLAPVPWHEMHSESTTCLPDRSAVWACTVDAASAAASPIVSAQDSAHGRLLRLDPHACRCDRIIYATSVPGAVHLRQTTPQRCLRLPVTAGRRLRRCA